MDALEAKLSYIQGIADRDREELLALRRKRQEHADRAESFAALVEAKKIREVELAREGRDALLGASRMSIGRSKSSLDDARTSQAQEDADARAETLAWNEAKRAADREAQREERARLREEVEKSKEQAENDENMRNEQKLAASIKREDTKEWNEAKMHAKRQAQRDERNRLVEIYHATNGEAAKQARAEAKAARQRKIQEVRDEKRAKYEMLKQERERSRREHSQRLKDQQAERAKSIRLRKEQQERERQRKADEREKKRQEINQKRKQQDDEKRRRIRRLQQRNELSMKANRNAHLLNKRAEQAQAARMREAARKDRLAMNAAKRKTSQAVRNHIGDALEAAAEARRALAAERQSLLAAKHGAKYASSASAARLGRAFATRQ